MIRHREKLTINGNDLVVENLKNMLISRDTTTQLKAVDFINNTCNTLKNNSELYKTIIEHLISSDLCVFLCEASSTLQYKLLLGILICLKRFSTFSLFYKKSYSPNVVASVVRTIHFLVKENGHENLINCSLYFLSEVFIRINAENICPVLSIQSSYNAPQLLELISTVIEKENVPTDTKLAVTVVLHSLMSEQKVKIQLFPKTISLLVQIIELVLDALCQLLVEAQYKHSSEHKMDCIFGMICHICMDSLYFIKAVDKHDDISNHENVIVRNYNEAIVLSVHKTLTIITSQIHTFDSSVVDPNECLFLSLLNIFLNESKSEKIIITFVDHLYANDFLTYLPRRRVTCTNKKTKWLYQINLAKLLSVLSSQNFNFSNWCGGEKNFSKHLYEGFLANECHPNQWPQILNDNMASKATINALIVYLYFCALKSSNLPDESTSILPYLIDYILNLPKRIQCFEPIIKCLWFIFAVASDSHTTVPLQGRKLNLERAKGKMASIASFWIKDVYTHHPILVTWVFSSSRIPVNIQRDVLLLWLDKECTLPQNLANNLTVWCSLLEIILTGTPRSIDVAANLLNSFIQSHTGDRNISDIASVIWDGLPDAISSYSAGKSNIETIVCIFSLCSSHIPEDISLVIVHRSSTLLLTLLSSPASADAKLQTPFIKLAYRLLNISLKEDDIFVLSQFINSPKLLQCIYNASQSLDADVSLMALKMLSFTSYYKVKFNLETKIFNRYIFIKHNTIQRAIDGVSQVDVTYYNFEKAFDRMDNDILLEKLGSFVCSGVPQDSILSPLTFNKSECFYATHKIFNFLSKLQSIFLYTALEKLKGTLCENIIKLDVSSIVRSLKEENQNDKVLSTLQLIYTVLTSKQNMIPLVVFCLEYPVKVYIDTFRTIFFRLQMVCCKELKRDSNSSWVCLNYMLRYAAYNNTDLVVALATQPWTHMLIRFYFNQNKPSKSSSKFLKFIYNWLTCLKVLKTKLNIYAVTTQADNPMSDKTNMLLNSLALIVNSYDGDDVLNELGEERKHTVINILNLISSYFD